MAVAGALMQGLTRNPLADPGIMGVSAGPALGIAFTTGVLGIGSLYGYVWFGFAGAVLTTAPVYVLGSAGAAVLVPQMAPHLAGSDHRRTLAYCALLGPSLLLAADIVGRLIARPDELDVGIVVTALGAPFFIALVRRRKLREL